MGLDDFQRVKIVIEYDLKPARMVEFSWIKLDLVGLSFTRWAHWRRMSIIWIMEIQINGKERKSRRQLTDAGSLSNVHQRSKTERWRRRLFMSEWDGATSPPQTSTLCPELFRQIKRGNEPSLPPPDMPTRNVFDFVNYSSLFDGFWFYGVGLTCCG